MTGGWTLSEVEAIEARSTQLPSGERWECPLCGDRNPRLYTSCRCGAPAAPLLANVYEPKLPWKQMARETLNVDKMHDKCWSPLKYGNNVPHTRPVSLSRTGTLEQVEAQIRRDFALLVRYPGKTLEAVKNERENKDLRKNLSGLSGSMPPAMDAISNTAELGHLRNTQLSPAPQGSHEDSSFFSLSRSQSPLHMATNAEPSFSSLSRSQSPMHMAQTSGHSANERNHASQAMAVSMRSGGQVLSGCHGCESLLKVVDNTLDAVVTLVEDLLSAASSGRASGGFTAETHARKGVQEILAYAAKQQEDIAMFSDHHLDEAYSMLDDLCLTLKVPVSRRPPPPEIEVSPPTPEPGRMDYALERMKSEAQRAYEEYQWEWWTHDDRGRFTGIEPLDDGKMNWWTKEQNAQTRDGMDFGFHGVHTFKQWNANFDKNQPDLDRMDESLDMLQYYEQSWAADGRRGTAPWLQPAAVTFTDDFKFDEGMQEEARRMAKRPTAPYLLPEEVRQYQFLTQRPKMVSRYQSRRSPEEVFGYKEQEADEFLKKEGYVSPDDAEGQEWLAKGPEVLPGRRGPSIAIGAPSAPGFAQLQTDLSITSAEATAILGDKSLEGLAEPGSSKAVTKIEKKGRLAGLFKGAASKDLKSAEASTVQSASTRKAAWAFGFGSKKSPSGSASNLEQNTKLNASASVGLADTGAGTGMDATPRLKNQPSESATLGSFDKEAGAESTAFQDQGTATAASGMEHRRASVSKNMHGSKHRKKPTKAGVLWRKTAKAKQDDDAFPVDVPLKKWHLRAPLRRL
eukprot:gnl/MRDRNA2_/MRDRNA2_108050_c0_seq1.p1 gnl/MRDRNA2_/MRDRNA2_108050_c0~~gnl/MRDRNA2_/MRDRNA2_108050_c0_seq1.p1  ORF type:complete len:796 (-),score=158.60 gnl/MRDRNA2_/MRDRNA2_108050_c0_seq1:40-2427(-)